MPSVAELRKIVPELEVKLGISTMEAAVEKAKGMGKKALGALRAELLMMTQVPAAGGAGGPAKKKKPIVSAEEAKVLEQTDSAFLPEAIAASTKKLVSSPPRAKDTRAKAEAALEEVGISVVKRARKPKAESAAKEKQEVAKALKEVESDVKLLEAEKKGLLKSGVAKAKARELRFSKAASEEGAEMMVKEGAAKAKGLLGKVKGEVVGKVKARKEKAVKAVKAVPAGRKTALRTHKVAVEEVVPPALGHPKAPAVPKAKHMHGAAVERELMRVGISV